MNKEQNILNREAVMGILSQLASEGRMASSPAVIFQMVADELTDICVQFQRSSDYTVTSILDRYAALRPTDAQIRCALIALLDAKKNDDTSYLFTTPRQYLAVFKVLVFLGIMNTDYGCYANMETYIAGLFACDAPPRVPCLQEALSKKCIGKPYTLPLSGWEPKRSTKELKNYWPVAVIFLNLLQKESGTQVVSLG